MSRSNYTEDGTSSEINLWRGAVESAIHGKRGQKLLRELAVALDAMPVKRLIAEELEAEGEVCALGCLGRARAIDMTRVDPYEPEDVGRVFGIAPAMAQEIVYVNDQWERHATPEQRWVTVREWVEKQIKETK